MSKHTLILSEHTYQALREVAQKQGLTPEKWILSQLSRPQPEAEPLSEKIGDLIGAIDSQVEPHHQFQSTDFGGKITTKLSKLRAAKTLIVFNTVFSNSAACVQSILTCVQCWVMRGAWTW